MTSDRTLRRALLANACFSAASGILLASQPDALSAALGTPALPLRVIGLVLLPFAVFLAFIATRPSVPRDGALQASVSDFAWVVATAALLLGWPESLNATGRLVAGGVALIVGALGACQLLGLRQSHANEA